MNISLIDLVNFFSNKTSNMDDYITSLKQTKKLETKLYSEYNFTVSNFSYNDSLNNLIFFLLYSNVIQSNCENLIEDNNDQFDRITINLNSRKIAEVKEFLINCLNSDKYNFPFSKKKIINLINCNQYNHELILMICGIYEINIFVFYKDINLFKLYYPEDKLKTKKLNLFLQYSKDTYSSVNSFQIMSIDSTYLLPWKEIANIVNKNSIQIYPIGINENKILFIDESINNDEYSIFIKTDNMIQIKNIIFDGMNISDIKLYKKIIQS
jgi:hypothetical protein